MFKIIPMPSYEAAFDLAQTVGARSVITFGSRPAVCEWSDDIEALSKQYWGWPWLLRMICEEAGLDDIASGPGNGILFREEDEAWLIDLLTKRINKQSNRAERNNAQRAAKGFA